VAVLVAVAVAVVVGVLVGVLVSAAQFTVMSASRFVGTIPLASYHTLPLVVR
jgi:hypothetical protein